ncbi:MAG: septum formation protein Maf [Ruminococcaceae bacterium]|nr:septum formation protein Maf [Oscillospiraceae bacterium]
MDKPLILASASPRRREILTLAGIPFEVFPADEEVAPEGLPAVDRVLALARSKATWVAARHPGRTVLGADTMVAVDNVALGKPHSASEAVEMLLSMQGREHQVLTGVWVIRTDESGSVVKEDGFTDVAHVKFYPFDREEAEHYVSTNESMDKAGAYAIQGKGMRFVEGIRGDFYTVMGLPGGRLVRFLRDFDQI